MIKMDKLISEVSLGTGVPQEETRKIINNFLTFDGDRSIGGLSRDTDVDIAKIKLLVEKGYLVNTEMRVGGGYSLFRINSNLLKHYSD